MSVTGSLVWTSYTEIVSMSVTGSLVWTSYTDIVSVSVTGRQRQSQCRRSRLNYPSQTQVLKRDNDMNYRQTKP